MQRAAGHRAVPDGWQRVRLGDVAELNRINWEPSDGGTILYLDLTAVSAPGTLSPPKALQASEAPSRARRRVRSGDILISTVRPNLRGFARVRKAEENLVASTGFAVVAPTDQVVDSFVYQHVMTLQFADFLVGATTGQAYPAVRATDVEEYPLFLPPLPEQRAIAAVLDSIDDAIESAETVIAATGQLRDSLLHDLLTRGLPASTPSSATSPASAPSRRTGRWCAWGMWRRWREASSLTDHVMNPDSTEETFPSSRLVMWSSQRAKSESTARP